MSVVDDMTIRDVKELTALLNVQEAKRAHSFTIGKKYLIRTVTYHHVGLLSSVTDTDLVLDDASWVASSGRWNAALRSGELDEVEPHGGSVIVSRGAIVDAVRWAHDLPSEVK
jgi:hypothetical protein